MGTDRSSRPETGGEAPRLTPEMIERFRQTGIRLDREGRLWHEGAEITHPGLRRALLRWLDRREDGRPILRLDAHRYAYIDVEDAELLVLSARWEGDRAWLALNDGSEEELDYASLEIGDRDALYCAVRQGRLRARITTPAYYVLADRIEPADAHGTEPGAEPTTEPDTGDGADAAGDGSFLAFVLRARGTVFPIRQRQGQ